MPLARVSIYTVKGAKLTRLGRSPWHEDRAKKLRAARAYMLPAQHRGLPLQHNSKVTCRPWTTEAASKQSPGWCNVLVHRCSNPGLARPESSCGESLTVGHCTFPLQIPRVALQVRPVLMLYRMISLAIRQFLQSVAHSMVEGPHYLQHVPAAARCHKKRRLLRQAIIRGPGNQ